MNKQAVVAETVPGEVQADSNVVPVSETAALMEVISKAASDPNVDVDKMERLFAMHERITDRNAEVAFNVALAEMQPELPVIDENGAIKTRGGQVQSTYAKWEDIDEVVQPILHKHGFSLSFRTKTDQSSITVTAVLRHREGYKELTDITLPPDDSGSKNRVQAFASSISYGKRYTGTALLNITTRGEDDDGQGAGNGKPETSNEWRGPLNKTTLSSRFNAFCKALFEAMDMASVEAAWTNNKDVLAQVKDDAPSWWSGHGDVPSVERRLQEAKARARFVTHCRNTFAESPTLDQLQYIFGEEQAKIQQLPDLHKNEVIRAKDERKAELERERNLA